MTTTSLAGDVVIRTRLSSGSGIILLSPGSITNDIDLASETTGAAIAIWREEKILKLLVSIMIVISYVVWFGVF